MRRLVALVCFALATACTEQGPYAVEIDRVRVLADDATIELPFCAGDAEVHADAPDRIVLSATRPSLDGDCLEAEQFELPTPIAGRQMENANGSAIVVVYPWNQQPVTEVVASSDGRQLAIGLHCDSDARASVVRYTDESVVVELETRGPGRGDCADLATVELAEPLGDRTVVDAATQRSLEVIVR